VRTRTRNPSFNRVQYGHATRTPDYENLHRVSPSAKQRKLGSIYLFISNDLNSLNEGLILKALREEGAGRTVALVSHRKSTMGVADRVYSADGGR
jgi:ABC-type transport system involved in Fe-S cluster assembly fused permease/ATPase subunit